MRISESNGFFPIEEEPPCYNGVFCKWEGSHIYQDTKNGTYSWCWWVTQQRRELTIQDSKCITCTQTQHWEHKGTARYRTQNKKWEKRNHDIPCQTNHRWKRRILQLTTLRRLDLNAFMKFMRESEKYNEHTKRKKNVPKYFNVNHKQRPNRGTYAYTTENANEGLEMS